MVPRILIPLLLLCATAAHGEFSQWTSKDGKVAELELLKLEKKSDAETVTFRTRAGKTVTMNLTDLQEADWQRAREAAAPPAAADAAPAGNLKVAFERATVFPDRPVPGSTPLPAQVEYRFQISGSNYAGLKADSLVVEPLKIGNRTVSARSWMPNCTPGAGGVTLTLSSPGKFDEAKLSGSKLSGSLIAYSGTVVKTEKIEMKVPKEEGKLTYAKAGPFTVHLGRDVRQVTVGIDEKDRQRIISYRLDGSTSSGGFSLDLVKVDKTVPVIVDYWEELKENTLKLEGTPP
ncbi:hypothetical protein [Haloferula sp. BvORR071]|uniref:hypothetical protein n=1 Tax=Haloferula sp. BvORR071 TaxID=1396141 RepID=UPI000554DAE5|nr:hypothetical protein [Haloferula sp. BvORR071]